MIFRQKMLAFAAGFSILLVDMEPTTNKVQPVRDLPPAPEYSDKELDCDALLSIELTAFEWHNVLNELAYAMQFAPDLSLHKRLLERIATQLNGAPVKYDR